MDGQTYLPDAHVRGNPLRASYGYPGAVAALRVANYYPTGSKRFRVGGWFLEGVEVSLAVRGFFALVL